MVLNRSKAIPLVDLRFSDLEHLKTSCDGSSKHKWEQTITRLASNKAFDHAERVFDEAKLKMQDGDEENAYQLFTRMGIISKIIIHKNDFQEFKNSPNGRRFYYLFDQCIEHLKELECSLNKRYELKKIAKIQDEKDSKIVQEEMKNEESKITGDSLTIDPRDLMRYLACKHQVLIIDYRDDQSDVVQCSGTGQLMVAQVPADAVVPGCIGSSLIRSAEISQRVLLQRMADVDMVVLMGSENVPTDEKDLIAGSKEQILYSALSTYNNNFRLKRLPLFLKGGFESWRLYYPMHTSKKSAIRRKLNIANRSEFAKAVAEYKKGIGIESLEYPQLLPGTQPKIKRLSLPHSSVSDSAIHQITQSPSCSLMTIGLTDLSAPSGLLPVKENASLEAVLDASNITKVFSNVSDGNLKFGSSGSKGDGSSSLMPDVQSSILNSTKHRTPTIDRSKKPLELPAKDKITEKSPPKPTQTVGGAKIYQADAPSATRIVVPAVPDRHLKPQLLSSDGMQQLMHLYDSMMNTLGVSALRRNTNNGYTGLYNLGNTCFMNAVLQALFNTSALQEIFTKKKFIKYVNRANRFGSQGVISSAFSALTDAYWSGLFAALRPQQFLETFAIEVNSALADGQQHDAQEFQIYLLDALHEDTNLVVKRIPFEQNYTGANLEAEAADYNEKLRRFANSPVNEIFSCQTISRLQCSRCKKQSVTFEEMTQLSVEVPNRNSTIEECIWNHFQDVELDGSCKWRCPDCKILQSATRRTSLWKLPKVLVVHLKRFTCVEDRWQKSDANVKFSTLPIEIENVYYSLYAVVNHRGNLNSGHYTAVVHNQITKQWLLFDDDIVTTVDVDSICSKYAFILYYKMDYLSKPF